MDLSAYKEQVSNRVQTSDTISSIPAELYRTTFDPESPALSDGDALPAGRHGLYFQSIPSSRDLRPDGSASIGSVVPDIPLPKRVFGSETTRFIRPMRIGQEYVHVSELIGVRESGQLVLVNTREQIADSEGPVVETERVTVFMGDTPPGTKPAAVVVPIDAPWKETRVLDAIDLFRFSAFTVNAHRAHYDQEWTSEVEGYPALLVHGPLTAMLLLDFALRNLKGSPASYEVRAMAPLFVDERFQLLGCPTPDGADLWAISHSGIAMRAHLSMGAAA